jgi:hypothetical protein
MVTVYKSLFITLSFKKAVVISCRNGVEKKRLFQLFGVKLVFCILTTTSGCIVLASNGTWNRGLYFVPQKTQMQNKKRVQKIPFLHKTIYSCFRFRTTYVFVGQQKYVVSTIGINGSSLEKMFFWNVFETDFIYNKYTVVFRYNLFFNLVLRNAKWKNYSKKYFWKNI